MLLALILAATPCDALWPEVWKAARSNEKESLVAKAWAKECAAFDQATLDCARGAGPGEVLRCSEVKRALDRALAAAAKVPRSDDCMGDDLLSGRCACAHSRCIDVCCPAGWACAHMGATQAKCIKPR